MECPYLSASYTVILWGSELPTVSIVISVFNEEKYLAEVIESILRQTYTDFELIICDDCSTDKSLYILYQYKEKYSDKIHIIANKENHGQAHARNRCIKIASGQFIAIMDADDRCDPTRLEKQVAFLSSHPEISFVGTGMTFFDEGGTWAIRLLPPYPSKEDYVPHAPFCLASCMFRREALEAVGGYNEKPIYRQGEDYELVVSLLEKGYKGANIVEPLYFCREGTEVYKKRRVKERLTETWKIANIVKRLKLPIRYYIYALRPLLLALLPGKLYMFLHRSALKRDSND